MAAINLSAPPARKTSTDNTVAKGFVLEILTAATAGDYTAAEVTAELDAFEAGKKGPGEEGSLRSWIIANAKATFGEKVNVSEVIRAARNTASHNVAVQSPAPVASPAATVAAAVAAATTSAAIPFTAPKAAPAAKAEKKEYVKYTQSPAAKADPNVEASERGFTVLKVTDTADGRMLTIRQTNPNGGTYLSVRKLYTAKYAATAKSWFSSVLVSASISPKGVRTEKTKVSLDKTPALIALLAAV
jgi:hypothetical protein